MSRYIFLIFAAFVGLAGQAFGETFLTDSFGLAGQADFSMGRAVSGDACSMGEYGYDSEGTMLFCINNEWKKMAAGYIPGTLCGGSKARVASKGCAGLNPASSCPDGYDRKYYIDSVDMGWGRQNVYHCVKT